MHLVYGKKTDMLISKFNKLIHNKIVWAAFAVLVSLSMVGLFAPSVGSSGPESTGSAGTLFDKPVSREDLMKARLFVQAFQPSRSSEQEQQMVTERAWSRLAIRRYADALGLGVSIEELSDVIARDPSFAVNGTFSRQRYQQLVESQMRVPVRLFEEYLHEEILIRKVQDLLAGSLWIPPYELEQSVSRFTDLFTIDVVELVPSNLVKDVSVSDEDIRNVYDRDPVPFEVPEQRSVYYVEWSADELGKTVSISDAQVQDAYDRDIEKYSITDTNTMTVSYTPLAEVSDQIRSGIAKKEGITIAGESAMQFLDDLGMLGYGDDVSIHSVAKKSGLTVVTSDFFTATAPVPGVRAGLSFNKAAFLLDPQVPEKSYSGSVIGEDAVYVLAWNTNRPSFLPPFEEVAGKAKSIAIEKAREKEFDKKLADIREKLKLSIAAKEPFKAASEALNLTAATYGPFSVYNAGTNDFPHFSDLAPSVLALSSGDLSDPIQLEDRVLIAHVAERVPGDKAEAVALKPDINRMLQSGRMRMHFAAWSEYLLSKARGASPVKDDQDPIP
jgi:hypothetical protein